MSLVRINIPLTQIQLQCREWARQKWGPDIAGDSHYRYLLNDKESTSLYRTHSRELGIPQRSSAEENLDRWFRPNNPLPPDPIVTESCLYYSPHIEGVSDRFEIILSTPQQREIAWKFGHKKQMVMDLTFGVCSARALLAILMAIDDSNHGQPVAFIMFTARKEAKATHADYNSALLRDLLERWKAAMGRNEADEEFSISIANTDNDPRERHALEANWPDIFLILCMFHTYQAWRNRLNKYLHVIPKGISRQQIRCRLGAFLMRQLQEIIIYDDAVAEYNAELAFFKNLGKEGSMLAKKMSRGGLAFLAYFHSYLKLRSFWLSWSKAGAIEAAERLGQPVDKIARTTNHVESFNGRIKGKYFSAYRRAGRLPRIDMWILTIITKVMPTFFQTQKDKQTLDDYYENLRYIGPSSVNTDCTKRDVNPCNAQILDDLLNDSEASSDSTDEAGFEDEDGYGLELFVEQDGNSSLLVHGSDGGNSIITNSPSESLLMMPQDHDYALDESLIICNLPNDIAPPFPDDSSVSNFDLPLLPPLHLKAAPKPYIHDTAPTNQEVTAMQRLLMAEDVLAQEITLFLQITDNLEIIAFHISLAIQACLSATPEPILNLKTLASPKTKSPSIKQRVSVSPPLSFSVAEPSQRALVPFSHQLKQ